MLIAVCRVLALPDRMAPGAMAIAHTATPFSMVYETSATCTHENVGLSWLSL